MYANLLKKGNSVVKIKDKSIKTKVETRRKVKVKRRKYFLFLGLLPDMLSQRQSHSEIY